ncbi:MAG: hypothetical protein MAG431_00355 [Chloroflexi bacterium]|nr:hypothetical protein [Chloroflexota bacterium]
MTKHTSTLDKLKTLESLYNQGYQSDVIDRALSKIIALESTRSRQKLNELESRLTSFEQKYHMKSDNFYTLFRAGELGDDVDFFEWSALYDMFLTLRQRLQSLKSEVE